MKKTLKFATMDEEKLLTIYREMKSAESDLIMVRERYKRFLAENGKTLSDLSGLFFEDAAKQKKLNEFKIALDNATTKFGMYDHLLKLIIK